MITTKTLFIKAPSVDLAWDLAGLALSVDAGISAWIKKYIHETEDEAREGEHIHPEGILYRIERSAVPVSMENEYGPARENQAFVYSTGDYLWNKVDLKDGHPVFNDLAWVYATAAGAFERKRGAIEYEGEEAVKDFGVYLLTWSIAPLDSSA
ncbi:hypothetical protein ABT282_07285 [Streptomyces sp. NPDC000927]|uniref:hypothetical protein n=1 Tax=Streptomyces sp. NPDC000927 TaxID=3154371 RepID=UPI0033273C40